MSNCVIKNIILLLIIMLGTLSVANAGNIKRASGSELPFPQLIKYDGIWVGPGNVTLVKQLDGYVILQGKDKVSTWWARGVISGNKLICRGGGATNNGSQFVYESSVTFESGILKDSWKAIFPEGKELQGDDVLIRVEVEQLDKATQTTR